MIEFDQVSLIRDAGSLYNVSMTLHQCDFNVVAMLDTGTLEAIENLLTCRMRPTHGQIRINGAQYEKSTSIIYVSSIRNYLIEQFTVGQNLYGLGGGTFFNKRKAGRECDALMQKFGFHIGAEDVAGRLNSEDQKVVELLRAYIKNPKVLILSEVLNVLSLKNLLHVKGLLEDMRRRGTYVLLLTRKYDDVFKLGNAVFVLRDGHLIESFANDEFMRDPQRLYEAFLGGSSIFAKEQFAASGDGFDMLDIVRIGTQCMLSQENVNSVLQKYAVLTEQYFSDVRCVIYLRKLGSSKQMERYYSGNYLPEQVPVTNAAALEQVLLLDEPLNMIAFDSNMHTVAPDFPCTNILYKPIKRNGVCEGILQISFRKPYSVSTSDVDYLQMVSDEISLILDNCRLMGNSSCLQEMNHRIKNNLQLITSMLMLEKTYYRESVQENYRKEDVGQLLDTTIARIQGIAGIHNLLMRRDVLNDMIGASSILNELHRFYRESIDMRVEKNGLKAPISHARASSFAMVMNELINNSIKHNPEKEGLCCHIQIMEEDGMVEVIYKDNGVGYPENGLLKGVGLTVIEAIVKAELWGTIQTYNDGGACTVLKFPESSLS